MRILFVSDIHGAEIIFKKSLNAAETYAADVLVLSGDLTGKDIRPIIKKNENSYLVNYRDKVEVVTASSLPGIEQKLANEGHYFFYCLESELEQLREAEEQVFEIMDQKILERLEIWAETIIHKYDLTKRTIFITPGNDDNLGIDSLLEDLEKRGIQSNLHQPFRFPTGNEMISLDYSNPTPWDTPREVNEKELAKKIKKKINKLSAPEKAIFHFHCPPFETKIDLAPELDENLKPVIVPGVDTRIHVGSTAVREYIEKYRPLLGLHGHIHESPGEDRIGPTICLNPGSEYWNGILHAYIIDIDNSGRLEKYFHIEG